MEPELNSGSWVFTTVAGPVPDGLDPVVTVAEAEGTTLVLPRAQADAAGLAYDFVAAWITLRVHSALDAVGLTAAFANRLADLGMSCNVVAGFFHDHLFVAEADAERAMHALRALAHEHRP
ncbi:ACT domain-containing protein [Yinghuangia sp. KLBMP8922]|uniref:ACT domain-containing protein n=2 Tax=Yinghuangia soli TaxID=2908204 RepID=A0AA41TZS1_9ACTN|nr:ACT domain-containing protein [Yinghuangia soli]